MGMSPFVMLLLALITPFLLVAVALVPVYLAMLGASYIIYPKPEATMLAHQALDVFPIVETYQRLFANWTQHMTALPLLHYTLPLLALPAIAMLLSLFLLKRLMHWLINVFHISVGGH